MTVAPRTRARLLAAALASLLLPGATLAQDMTPPSAVKAAYALRLREEGLQRRDRHESARERLAREREARRGRLRARGERLRPARPDDTLLDDPANVGRRPRSLSAFAFTTPTNRIVNNPLGEATNETQSETSIVGFGDLLVAAWNDGLGFPSDTQGWGTSNDGGQTWVDRGVFPHAPGRIGFQWASDPVLAVNEKTGAFYFSALCEWVGGPGNTTVFSGVGVVKGRWSGSTFVWGDPAIADSVSFSAGLSLDKQWLVADSTSGRLYLTSTLFSNAAGSQVMFTASDSNGVAWAPRRQLSLDTPTENGWVQGARPIVDGDGRVYVMYYLIGQGFADYYRVLRSTNGGATFNSPVTAESLYTNFGTGCPGFNRDLGIQFAGLGVDRSHGPNRGRLYLSWAESINWLDDMLGYSPVDQRNEVEGNGAPGTATPAVVGSRLRGTLSSSSDLDYWAIPLTAGQHIVVAGDSVAPGAVLTLRMYSRNGSSSLAFTTFDATVNPSAQFPGGIPSGWMFTAPTTGTYYVRVASRVGAGAYRLRIGAAQAGSERGRDQRDVFVAWSDDGLSWSPPRRVSEDPAGYDAFLPELAVAPDGGLYTAWYDFRDATTLDGGASNVYAARSGDGGVTWTTLGALSDSASNWSAIGSTLEPNLGDYISLFTNAGGLWAAWADARRGGPDVFAAQMPLIPNGAQVSFVNVQFGNRRITLDWSAQPADTLTMRLYRADDDGPFQYLDIVQFDAAGQLTYTDTTVTGDHAYRYRLGRFSNAVELFYGQVNVFLPGSFPLSLSRPRPNPVTGGTFGISFSLATNAPADLILHDVAGREVYRRTVSLGMGPHTLTLPVAGGLKQGLYVLTLRQGGRNTSTRVHLVR